MIKKYIILTLAFIFTIGAFAQNDNGEKVETRLVKVRNDIYVLYGKGGNIGLSFGDESILMIDDQYADLSEYILKDIRRISKKPIQFLFNTHHHGDHVGGNENMAAEGAIIISQENARKRIIEAANKNKLKLEENALPVITFNENMKVYQNGETIQAFHIHNAHTDGDIAIYFPETNVIHTGDAFINSGYPYIDVENGGSVKGYIGGLSKIEMLCNEDTKIIPGHGEVASLQDVTFTKNMLNNIYKQITFQYVNEKSLEEVLAMKDITAEYDEKGYGKGFISTEKFVTTLYNEVKRQRGPIDKRSMEERLQDKFEKQQKDNKN